MAVQNHPAMYSGGAVVLDTSPLVNLYARVLAQKQAKIDALDEYDRNRVNNINTAGLRDQDREEFNSKVDNLRSYYIENKNKIRKGNTPEALQYERLIRESHAYINDSKERTAKQDAAVKLIKESYQKDGVIPSGDDEQDNPFKDLDLNDRPLNDPNGKSFDLPKWLSISQKPHDVQSNNRKYDKFKRTPGQVKYEPIPGQPLKMMEVIEEKFDLPTKGAIAEMAATDYHNKGGYKREVEREYSNPVTRAKLAEVFKKEFGIAPAQMEDYAAAYQLSIMQPSVVKSKPVDNKDAIMTRRQKYAIQIQNMITNRAYGLKHLSREFQVKDQIAQDEMVEGVVDGYVASGVVDPDIIRDYEKKDDKGAVPISKVVISPDGEIFDFIVEDKNGKVSDHYSTKGIPRKIISAKTRKLLETPTTSTKKPATKPVTNKKATKGKPY